MDDLIQEFIAETRETLEALSGEIVAWEANPTDRARLDAIFRFVHTVKGSCGFLDLPRLARLSHAAEDGLQAVREGKRVPDSHFVDAVLAIVDRIGELTEAIDQGRSLDDSDDENLIRAIDGAPAIVAAESAGPANDRGKLPARSVRLGVELLDRMMGGMSDLVLVRNELARRIRDAGAAPEIEAALDRLSTTVADLRDTVTRTRMQRIESLFSALPRMARDTAAELGKAVTLVVEGGDVELDREMIEMIRDPLAHIMRNAIDHGIESPAERTRLGKRENGRIRVCARQAGNQIEIIVSDDGRGIDTEKLGRKLIDQGTLTAAEFARMSEAAKRELIFRPGVSTAAAVTQVSGRGVGMDVVRANVERIGGVVALDSEAGQGLSVVIRVPLTLSIISAISVCVGGQRFAIPRTAIEEIVAADNPMLHRDQVGSASVVRLRDRAMPLVQLGDILALPAEGSGIIAVVSASEGSFALAADAIGDHEELVIKPAAPLVMATGRYAGETLPDSGMPMLVLDISGIARVAGLRFDRTARPDQDNGEIEAAADRRSILLFRGTDGIRRGIGLSLVDRIESLGHGAVSIVGGKPHVVLDGRVVPLAGGAAMTDEISVLRLHDGVATVAYAIDQALDIVEIAPELAPPSERDGGILGIALIDGDPVEILDPYWLFARQGQASYLERTCALVADADGWMAGMLRPLIESAGYRVTMVASPDEAEGPVVSLGETRAKGPVVALRRDADPGGPDDRSVYRYDRDGLFAALEQLSVKGGRA
ncbi:chemotaxis protein CheA [Sphingomonas gilva]|uniref:Chemotaxis protein CheA n=1 Tax=Sphingomonas gilva TaxID=2305907 RepID=A0A396RMW3_9SPHN|nr:chemotaxis protein CheA [Sphingomonas gilva]RHW16492.1 chemotaxis protein CheA [Sphingomonas gilva]